MFCLEHNSIVLGDCAHSDMEGSQVFCLIYLVLVL